MFLRRIQYNLQSFEEIVQFSLQNNYGVWKEEKIVRRFISQLIDSPESVIDLHNDTERIAVGVLIENIVNPDDASTLEFLAARPPYHLEKSVILQIIQEGIYSFRKSRQNLHVSIGKEIPIVASDIEPLGFKFCYAMYDLHYCGDRKALPKNFPDITVGPLTEEKLHIYHDVLTRSFAQNIECNIPPLETLKANFKTIPQKIFLVYKNQDVVAFFCTLYNEAKKLGDITTIGVLPEARGIGLGKFLLFSSIQNLVKQGASEITLSVAVKNEKALSLYLNSGFEKTASSTTFKYSRP